MTPIGGRVLAFLRALSATGVPSGGRAGRSARAECEKLAGDG